MPARHAARVFSPLDEKLALLPTTYSPTLVETMTRLGTRLPFAQVADELARLFGVAVSADTVRRITEQAGSLQVAIEQQELERLEREAPEELPGPALQQVSADGAMVSLTDGSWTEVRTIAIGTITEQDGRPHADALSYFGRRCSASEFIRQATLPTHERGTRRAGTVVAVFDGAAWLQPLADRQCPDAVRILDFPHAVGYLSQAAQAAFGSGSREAAVWLDEWAPKLKTREPEEVLAALGALPTPSAEAGKEQREARHYLAARVEQIRYARFRERGYPIGSGIVESACKLVVQARLKGSGMSTPRGRGRSGMSIHSWRCVVVSAVVSGHQPGRALPRPGEPRCVSDGREAANAAAPSELPNRPQQRRRWSPHHRNPTATRRPWTVIPRASIHGRSTHYWLRPAPRIENFKSHPRCDHI